MNFSRPIKFIVSLVVAVSLASLLNVAVTKKSFSENYPATVCPPTLAGLNSQISLSSKKTPFQRLQNRSTKTDPVRVLRLPVKKDSLVLSSEGVTPVMWQSRAGSWAGGTLCTGPASSQWFVGATADISSRGRLIIVNSGLSDAIVDVQAFTENGKQPLKTINVSSKNYIVIPVDSLAPGDKSLAIHVAPRSGRVNAFAIDERSKGLSALGGDFVNPALEPKKSVIIPAIPNQIPKKSKNPASPHTLRILTPGDLDASFTVEVLSTDGVFVPVGFTSRSISAGIVSEFELAPKITSNVLAIRVTATQPVVASVFSKVNIGGKNDFVWSTAASELTPLTMAVTGLTPLIVFSGDSINISLKVTLINGKIVNSSVKGSDIATWRAPASARSFSITRVGASNYAGALVSSVNGYGYFPITAGSVLTKIELPNSNIRVLNP